MALNEDIPIDGDGIETGTRVDEICAAIRALRASLNAGKLDRLGAGTGGVITDPDTGVVTLTGTSKVHVQKPFVFNYTRITAQGAPTLVNQGVFFGFTLPIYAADDQELFACICMPDDWDGITDPVIYVGGWLDTANTAKKFNIQLSVETVDFSANAVVPVTTNDYPIETTTGTWAQYTSFKIGFTIDASVIELAAGFPLAIRIRRLAASADEIAGNPVIEGALVKYVADKIGGAT